MKILSIETSCDDTALTIMEATGEAEGASFEILANATNSQAKLHSEYGGVYPNLAKNEHIKHLPLLLEKVLAETNSARPDLADSPVDAIAVTYGPGIEPSLWTGIVFAKELAEKWNVPLIPVNHMEGHILSVFGKSSGKFKIPKIEFPILSLLVSGGNTLLVLSESLTKHKIIGDTLDDAAGEAFDKVARMLDLPYPGGPHISKLAEGARASEKQSEKGLQRAAGPKIILPRPMLHSKDLNFSYSGLKTAVLYLIKKFDKIDDATKAKICLEFENAVVDTLVHKAKKAQEEYGTRTLVVGGGVACNTHLQRRMLEEFAGKCEVYFPEKALATDNSIMIGMSGYIQFLKNNKKGINPEKVSAKGDLLLS